MLHLLLSSALCLSVSILVVLFPLSGSVINLSNGRLSSSPPRSAWGYSLCSELVEFSPAFQSASLDTIARRLSELSSVLSRMSVGLPPPPMGLSPWSRQKGEVNIKDVCYELLLGPTLTVTDLQDRTP